MDKLLVVDDDPNIVRITKLYLEKKGYKVDTASDGMAACALAEKERYNLIVLDVMLPGMDGWNVCRTIRRTSDVPIIMLTARGEVQDRIEGLQLGADDYMVKPFDPNELVVRVDTVLRRMRHTALPQKAAADKVYSFGNLEVRTSAGTVFVGGLPVALNRKEYEMLLIFVQHANRIFTREDLIALIWGPDYEGEDRVVDVNIRRLRAKLGDASQGWQIITVWGLGYKFEVASP
ncbi:response regulator transcription factor [Gordoniibacillus kamchatkensis]|uniref:response regulator transcription factor n=1 Tax=Gordoniibacillus kamchatkensis TaxID=1590651 RepID=UPI000696D356|nr:response regulator transcription factor [Paenibacillus sp. VKM B-2647]